MIFAYHNFASTSLEITNYNEGQRLYSLFTFSSKFIICMQDYTVYIKMRFNY